jgi:hypothetical protein
LQGRHPPPKITTREPMLTTYGRAGEPPNHQFEGMNAYCSAAVMCVATSHLRFRAFLVRARR